MTEQIFHSKTFFNSTPEDKQVTELMKSFGFSELALTHNPLVVVFTGGSDVNPALYGHKRHPTTSFSIVRDIRDGMVWEAVKNNPHILKVGICRGAQFLCTQNKGVLWQDVDNHALRGVHPILYIDEKNEKHYYVVTSTHHQMMKPPGLLEVDFERWGFCTLASYRDLENNKNTPTNYIQDGPDNEIIYFPTTNSLCFQPHPEYSHTPTKELFRLCLIRALFRTSTKGIIL